MVLLLLSSCASTPQSRLIHDNFPAGLPLAQELTETPFYPQTEYQCGPAALATMLGFQGVETSIDELSRQIYLPARKGSLQIEIQSTARRHAMLAYQLEPQLQALLNEIAAGNPVLVLQNLSFEWYPKWHYAVVIGYDMENRDIILRSGTTRRWITPFEVFERTWQRADFWSLVILPAGRIPQTAQPLQYLKTAFAFEQTGHPNLAHTAYQAATQQWPQNPDSWLLLGNSAFQQQDWPLAITAFQSATRLNPASTDSWNNLAYALHANGCVTQAQNALQCGLKVTAEDKNLLDSQLELSASPAMQRETGCPLIHC